nr:hypothetical protein CFP56_08082 [Quercus suber]
MSSAGTVERFRNLVSPAAESLDHAVMGMVARLQAAYIRYLGIYFAIRIGAEPECAPARFDRPSRSIANLLPNENRFRVHPDAVPTFLRIRHPDLIPTW